jgi:hypothetical protein
MSYKECGRTGSLKNAANEVLRVQKNKGTENKPEKPKSWRRPCSETNKDSSPFNASGRQQLATLWQTSAYLPTIRMKTTMVT